MKKSLLSILFIMIVSMNCVQVPDSQLRDNPLDSAGVNWFPPSVQISPNSQIVSVGQTALVMATGTDNGFIAYYDWFIDGVKQQYTTDSLQILCSEQGTKIICVIAVDNDGVKSKEDTALIMAKDKAPLIFSPLPNATLANNTTTLQWHPGFYSNHYRVIADTVNPPSAIVNASTSDTFSVVSNLVFNKSYWWKVIGFDNAGDTASSETWKFITPVGPPIPTPTLTAWSVDSATIQTQWNSQSGATGYALQSASDSSGPFSQIYSGSDTTYANTGLTNNQKVWYRVKATNATQTSDWSDTAGAAAGQETAGQNWFEATAAAAFSDRDDHTSVVFNNKMWVIGGYNGSTNLNDVWSSSDGVTWIQATSAAASSGRNSSSVVFNNKMWLIGGWVDSYPWALSNIWFTSDGITWTQATSTAAFNGRAGHTSVVFDNKMWVIGGGNGSTIFNDVWYSLDGIIWTQATAAAAFSSRSGHTSVVFDNKIWVIGGTNDFYGCGGDRFNDVWYSSDGITWTQATSAAQFSGRDVHTSVVFDNKIWVIAGFTNGGNGLNDVWYTEDK